MKIGDYFIILWPIPLALYILGVSALGHSGPSDMSEWFEVLGDYKFADQFWHPQDTGAVFDWNTKWRDKPFGTIWQN